MPRFEDDEDENEFSNDNEEEDVEEDENDDEEEEEEEEEDGDDEDHNDEEEQDNSADDGGNQRNEENEFEIEEEHQNEKKKVFKKKRKRINELRRFVRKANTMVEKREYYNFESLLNDMTAHIKIYPNIFSETTQMPAFYVKYLSSIVDKIRKESTSNLRELQEKVKEARENKEVETQQKLTPVITELQAIQRLQRSMDKNIPMFKQIELYLKGQTSFWEGGDETLEDEMGQQDEEEETDVDFDDDQEPEQQPEEKDEEDQEEDHDQPEEDEDKPNGTDDENQPKKAKKKVTFQLDKKSEKRKSKNEDEDGDEDEEYPESEEEDLDENKTQKSKKAKRKTKNEDEDEDEDDEENNDDDDDVDWDDEEPAAKNQTKQKAMADADAELERRELGTGTGITAFGSLLLERMKQRSFWVKKVVSKKKAITRIRKPKPEKKQEEEEEKHDAIVEESVKRKREKTTEQWSAERIRAVFTDVLTSRGRTGVNRDEIVERLYGLIDQCTSIGSQQARLTVISTLLSFYFDTSIRKQSGMSGVRWRNTKDLLVDMLDTLIKNVDSIRMSIHADVKLALKEEEKKSTAETEADKELKFLAALQGKSLSELKKSQEKDKNGQLIFSVLSTGSNVTLDNKYVWVHGNLWSFIKRLREQLWVNLKSIDYRTSQYEKRLADTRDMIKLLRDAYRYYDKLGERTIQADINTTIMSLIYNEYDEKFDELKYRLSLENKNTENDDNKSIPYTTINNATSTSIQFGGKSILRLPDNEIVRLAKFIFKHGDTRMQTEAMLYLIYNMSIHNQYELCRDLLLMSHLSSEKRIGNTNIELQILYNRTLAQFAIASFIQGYWFPTMVILQELYGSNRIRVLLAQDVFISRNPTSEQLKQEALQAQRLLPPHLFINNDLLDATHLISSLFLEVPSMVIYGANQVLSKKQVKNKHFRKLWDGYLRRDLRVPPENTQSIILTAGILMQDGEFNKCKKLLLNLRLWNEIRHASYVQHSVFEKLKLECMRCYLYRFASVYETISIEKLSKMFELTQQECKQYICKMIISSGDERFRASFDDLTNCCIIHQQPPTPLQRVSLEYADKLSTLIEQNERLLGNRLSTQTGQQYNQQRWQRNSQSHYQNKYSNTQNDNADNANEEEEPQQKNNANQDGQIRRTNYSYNNANMNNNYDGRNIQRNMRGRPQNRGNKHNLRNNNKTQREYTQKRQITQA